MSMDDIYDAVLGYDDEAVAALVRARIDAGEEVSTVLDDGLIAAMDEVGALFAEGTLFVPEMLMAANAMKAGLEILRPLLSGSAIEPAGTVVIGTVRRDLHDIGKNLVGMMLEGSGFRVINLGVDVEPGAFADAALEHAPDIIGMSALLTTTMPAMKTTVDVLRQRGYAGPIMIGGAPVTREFTDHVGADGYAPDAPAAVTLARRLVEEARQALTV